MRRRIITLTLNPAVGKSTNVEGFKTDAKLRCKTPIYDVGGGGINVSRVAGKLGAVPLISMLRAGLSANNCNNFWTRKVLNNGSFI